MEIPRVQVIIPVYNAERYLCCCLDSLKNQTCSEWEALLVDDCSEDNSREIIKKYQKDDARFTLICQEQNGGVAKARNTALAKTTAPYIAFLDSDDYWEPDMLKKLLEEAEKTDADVVQCRFIYDFAGGKQKLPAPAFPQYTHLEQKGIRKVYLRMMTGINMNHVCMKLIKRETVADLFFDPALKTAEDLKYCVYMFAHVKRYSFIPDVMYHYRRNDTSLTGKGLKYREKMKANRLVSKDLAKTLSRMGIKNPVYFLLAHLRPYIITVSKILRMMQEKIMAEKIGDK